MIHDLMVVILIVVASAAVGSVCYAFGREEGYWAGLKAGVVSTMTPLCGAPSGDDLTGKGPHT